MKFNLKPFYICYGRIMSVFPDAFEIESPQTAFIVDV